MNLHRKSRILLINISAFGILCFAVKVIFNYLTISEEYSEYLLKSLKGPMAYDDPKLIQYIRDKVLVAPSKEPTYNLQKHFVDHFYRHKGEIFYENFTKELFNSTVIAYLCYMRVLRHDITRFYKRGGFFVEAGALDGETMSNTLWLEKHRGWTGLLVEPDPYNFKALLRKNRKAWSANVCLSIDSFPSTETFPSLSIFRKQEFYDGKARAMGSILRSGPKLPGVTEDDAYNAYYVVECLPLGSLLLALNVTKLDFLSLDIEFVEEHVFRNFDFKRFDVQTMFVEYYHWSRRLIFLDFLAKEGFGFIAEHFADMIFVKKSSPHYASILQLHPQVVFHVYGSNMSAVGEPDFLFKRR